MPGKIFVNYRRDDVPGDARGVRDGMAAKFGKANVFMDVDNLLVGQRFDVELAKALDACDIHPYRGLDATTWSGDQWNGEAVRRTQCAALGKPLIASEMGMLREVSGGTAARASWFDGRLAAWKAAGVDVAREGQGIIQEAQVRQDRAVPAVRQVGERAQTVTDRPATGSRRGDP